MSHRANIWEQPNRINFYKCSVYLVVNRHCPKWSRNCFDASNDRHVRWRKREIIFWIIYGKSPEKIVNYKCSVSTRRVCIAGVKILSRYFRFYRRWLPNSNITSRMFLTIKGKWSSRTNLNLILQYSFSVTSRVRNIFKRVSSWVSNMQPLIRGEDWNRFVESY